MSDIVRLDLSEKEAAALDATLKMAIHFITEVPVEILTVRAKLGKAQSNPLNGPTFAFGVCVPGGADPRDAAIDAEDEARLDSDHERFESIPEEEIPF